MSKKQEHRPWFQLHLSTCVVLMLAMGALLGLNLRPVEVSERSNANGNRYLSCRERGFPYNLGRVDLPPEADIAAIREQALARMRLDSKRNTLLVFNALICFAILVGVAAFFEWWIRDRARRELWWNESQEATRNVPEATQRLLNAKQKAEEQDDQESADAR